MVKQFKSGEGDSKQRQKQLQRHVELKLIVIMNYTPAWSINNPHSQQGQPPLSGHVCCTSTTVCINATVWSDYAKLSYQVEQFCAAHGEPLGDLLQQIGCDARYEDCLGRGDAQGSGLVVREQFLFSSKNK